VTGAFFLARAWRVAGLELTEIRGPRAVVLATIVVAAALIIPGVYFDFTSVGSGNLSDVALIASSLGDLCSLILVAPILYTALALRGGLLGWPWGLFAASMLAWLGYDTMVSLSAHLHVPGQIAHTVAETFRGLACTLTLSAGLAQRWVVDEARRADLKRAA
jgi:hypothetical protein